jgi:hypothetical protein
LTLDKRNRGKKDKNNQAHKNYYFKKSKNGKHTKLENI